MEMTDKLVDEFVESCQVIVDKDMESYPNQSKKLSVNKGKRYYKVIVTNFVHGNESGTSVWAFLDSKNGDVLKPAGWKAPAKHARGNLFDENKGTKYITSYGPAYLK